MALFHSATALRIQKSHVTSNYTSSGLACPAISSGRPVTDSRVSLSLSLSSVSDVLKCPLECARQTTLIAHGNHRASKYCFIFRSSVCSSEHFGRVTSIELLHKVHLIPKTKPPQPPQPPGPPAPLGGSTHTTSKSGAHVEIDTRPQTAIERLAYRFNQVGTRLTSL